MTQLGHVKDLSTAFVKVLGNKKAARQVYNISGERFVTFDGIAKVGALLGRWVGVSGIGSRALCTAVGYRLRRWAGGDPSAGMCVSPAIWRCANVIVNDTHPHPHLHAHAGLRQGNGCSRARANPLQRQGV